MDGSLLATLTELGLWGVFARCLGVVAILPFGDTLSVIPRLILAIGLTAVSVSSGDISSSHGLEDSAELSAWLWPVLEFVVGVVIGSPIRVVVESGEMLGEIIDTTRGQTIGSVQDPLSGHSGSDLAVVCRLGILVGVFHFGALEYTAATVVQSYDVLPMGSVAGGVFAATLSVWGSAVLDIAARSIQLALVWVVPFIVIDMVTAVAHRICTAFSFSVSGIVVKTMVTYMIFGLWLVDLKAAPSEWLSQIFLRVNDGQ
jgi:flagellar biosynthesis protein FliR